jgi:hypothetical protein
MTTTNMIDLTVAAHQAELHRRANRHHHRIERSGGRSPSRRRLVLAALRSRHVGLGMPRSSSAGPLAS